LPAGAGFVVSDRGFPMALDERDRLPFREVQTMNAYDLFSAGRLRDAIEAQSSDVQTSAHDSSARLFLFELLAFAGDLDCARDQLDRLQADEPRHASAIRQLRDALDAEEHRRGVFAGTRAPRCLGAAPDHLLLRLEALKYLADGDHAGR